jgi:hypothetical protein
LVIGRRGEAHGRVLMSFAGSVHNSKIMFGMLVKVLGSDSIATRRRLARKGNVTFEDLMRRAPDFDVRTVTLEILTSVRYRLPMTVGIVTVIRTIRSARVSCSHETFCIDGEVGSQSNESVSEYPRSDGVASLFCTAPALFRAGKLEGVVLVSNGFLVQCLAETGLIGAVSLFNMELQPRSAAAACVLRAALLAAARRGDGTAHKDQECEANFYLGGQSRVGGRQHRCP